MKTTTLGIKASLAGSWHQAPLAFKALAIGMLVSYLPGLLPGGIGIRVSYLGWMVPLLGCGAAVFLHQRRVNFPIKLWVPWAIWVVLYLVFAVADNALQRSVMLLTPLVVGAGFSTLRVDTPLLTKFSLWLNRFFWIFLAVAGVTTGLLVAGQLYGVTGFAAGSITASLLAVWYAARFANGDWRALAWWAALALVPVLANTRTGMLAVALTLPLTLAPLSIKKRLIAVALLLVAGLLAFQTEHIQRKMFFSGQGTVADAIAGVSDMFAGRAVESGDFVTSGRKTMNDALVDGLAAAYWLGYGANTTEAISFNIAGVTHPHNDWLRLRYEYGLLGLLIFALTMLAQMWHAYKRAKWLRSSSAAIFLYAGAGSFIPMAIFMASDNVMLYAAWFGNLQFAMLGLGYAALRSQQLESAQGTGR